MAFDIEAARARCEAATEGPWEWDGHRSVTMPVNDPPYNELVHGAHWKPNAEFIAEARTDLPMALELLKRCRRVFGEYFEDVEALMFDGHTQPSPAKDDVRAHLPKVVDLLRDLGVKMGGHGKEASGDPPLPEILERLGYEVGWDYSLRLGSSWHEVVKDGHVVAQIDRDIPLAVLVQDFRDWLAGRESTTEDAYTVSCGGPENAERFNELMRAVVAWADDNCPDGGAIDPDNKEPSCDSP